MSRPTMTPMVIRFNTRVLEELRDLAAYERRPLAEIVRKGVESVIREADEWDGDAWRKPERKYRHGWYAT